MCRPRQDPLPATQGSVGALSPPRPLFFVDILADIPTYKACLGVRLHLGLSFPSESSGFLSRLKSTLFNTKSVRGQVFQFVRVHRRRVYTCLYPESWTWCARNDTGQRGPWGLHGDVGGVVGDTGQGWDSTVLVGTRVGVWGHRPPRFGARPSSPSGPVHSPWWKSARRCPEARVPASITAPNADLSSLTPWAARVTGP